MARNPIVMPHMGPNVETGKLVRWLRSVGEEIVRGDPIAEIETDKTTVEMEALATGTLTEMLRQEGDEVAVGDVMGWIDDGG